MKGRERERELSIECCKKYERNIVRFLTETDTRKGMCRLYGVVLGTLNTVTMETVVACSTRDSVLPTRPGHTHYH